MSCDLFFYLWQVSLVTMYNRVSMRRRTSVVQWQSNGKKRDRERKMAVDKFAFSFDLHNNFTEYTLNPEFDTILAVSLAGANKNCFQITDFIPFASNRHGSVWFVSTPRCTVLHKLFLAQFQYIHIHFFCQFEIEIQKKCICAQEARWDQINTILSDGNDNVILIYSKPHSV